MGRLIVCSNRVAVPGISNDSPGGLATGISGALKENGGIWFGWSGEVFETGCRNTQEVTAEDVRYLTVDISKEEHELYYLGFANHFLWPLCHFELSYIRYSTLEYDSYRSVNRMMAERLVPFSRTDDLIWVHDYHLIPMAHELRALGVQSNIGFFLHVPFPSFGMLRSLPVAQELMACFMRYNVVGFQTEEDLESFRDSALRLLNVTIHSNDYLEYEGRLIRIGVFPIGVDNNVIQSSLANSEACEDEVNIPVSGSLLPSENRGLILGVDRIDYSKGLVEKLNAYELFLKQYPEYHKVLSLMQIATISRGSDPDYINLRERLENTVAHINGTYADVDWVPIHYLNRSQSPTKLMVLMNLARICMVTSLRDGMNLVSKEYVSAQNPDDPGVLILSELAGSAKQLEGALLVNPYDVESMARNIRVAVTMSRSERIERHASMYSSVKRYDLQNWRSSFIEALQATGSMENVKKVRAPHAIVG
ncbi:hypothetical protein A9Q99_00410 [Gammaproteobacteria bacterium 45_16_T64]|nr:hypothetical protein A9Q99_00410 [Gammaproteobacteria bacterium 45_16_T64]